MTYYVSQLTPEQQTLAAFARSPVGMVYDDAQALLMPAPAPSVPWPANDVPPAAVISPAVATQQMWWQAPADAEPGEIARREIAMPPTVTPQYWWQTPAYNAMHANDPAPGTAIQPTTSGATPNPAPYVPAATPAPLNPTDPRSALLPHPAAPAATPALQLTGLGEPVTALLNPTDSRNARRPEDRPVIVDRRGTSATLSPQLQFARNAAALNQQMPPGILPSGLLPGIASQAQANWRASLGKGVNVPPAPVVASSAPVSSPVPAPAPIVAQPAAQPGFQQMPLPTLYPTNPADNALRRLPCADGRCGPVNIGQGAAPIGPVMNSILGNYILADIVGAGNAQVRAANNAYDQMVQQRYMQDPAFYANMVTGLQRGLTPEAATALATAQAAYQDGNTNLGNDLYGSVVAPAEARVAATTQAMADSYNAPYVAPQNAFGDTIPYNGIYQMGINPDGTRNLSAIGGMYFNTPQYSSVDASQFYNASDPLKLAQDTVSGANAAWINQQDKHAEAAYKAQELMYKTAADEFKERLDSLGKLSPGVSAKLHGMSPLDMVRMQQVAQRIEIDAENHKWDIQKKELELQKALAGLGLGTTAKDDAELARTLAQADYYRAQTANEQARTKLVEEQTKTEAAKANAGSLLGVSARPTLR